MPNQDIGVTQLKEKLEAGDTFLFLDVREEFEYRQFNLGAELVPMSIIQDKIPELVQNKDREIIIHCLSGQRSATAKQMLINNGCTNVRNVLGGVLDWIDKFGPKV